MDYYERLKPIIEDVLGVSDLTVTPELCAADVEEWDSLNHVRLIVAVEKEFGVNFAVPEVAKFQNVGDMVAALEQKTGLPRTSQD